MTTFGGTVRAALDWRALERGGYSVRELLISSRDVLGRLTTVWYASPSGEPSHWDMVGAVPLTVRAASERQWHVVRKARIRRFVQAFEAREEPIQLLLPAVDAPNGAIVVIDGNHRACAAYLTKADIRALVFVLHGPPSPPIIPDLTHHQLFASDTIWSVHLTRRAGPADRTTTWSASRDALGPAAAMLPGT